MTTPFESLDDQFNIEPTEIVPEVEEAKQLKRVESSDKLDDREKDYQYARGQLYNIVEKMQETLNGAMEVAQQSDHPRAFEVVFQGAKHTADILDKMQDLHKKQKDLAKEEPTQGASGQVNHGTVNNVFMSGTTADMLKMLKESQQEDK